MDFLEAEAVAGVVEEVALGNMKIALVADAFPPYISGVTTHNIEFAKHALEQGHELLIFVPRHKPSIVPEGLEKATIVTLRSAPTPYANLRIAYPNMPKVVYYLQRFDPDVIWCNAASFTGIDAVMASKFLQIPTVSTFHTLYTQEEYLRMMFKIRQTKILEKTTWAYHRWFYNACDHIFVSTLGMQKYLADHGINNDKVSVSPILFNSQVVTLTSVKKEAFKSQYNLKKNVAVYLGRISQEKSLDTLLEAWEQVTKKQDDCTLLVIGGGAYEAEFRRLVKDYNLEDSVAMTGFIENATLLDSGLLSVADCYVTASTSETWGVATLEAMAHGLPVILAKSLGVSEILDGAGYVVDKSDIEGFALAILELFGNPDKRHEMGAQARSAAQQYSGELGTEQIIKQFKEIQGD